MTEAMKAARLNIAVGLAQESLTQIGGVIVTPDHVETLGEIAIALQDVIQKAGGLSRTLLAEEAHRQSVAASEREVQAWSQAWSQDARP
jgi:hypothetical protein